MPLINVHTSATHVSNAQELLKELSAVLADSTGKPEKYVMSMLQTDLPMTFGGSSEPCCYVEIKSIGSIRPPAMTELFCKLIESKIGISANRIYINFEDIEAGNWGFNGQTFG